MKNNIVKVKKIDAKDMPLGRLASEVAHFLMGKDDPSYQRHNANTSSFVYVFNTDFIKFTGNKLDGKVYYKYSGYPGGLRKSTLKEMIEKKGSEEVFKKAVFGMLPKNKLRPIMLKKLRVFAKELK